MTGSELFGIIGGLGGVLAIVVVIANALKSGPNTPESTWQAAIADLRREVSELETKLTATQKSLTASIAELDQLRGGVLILTGQLRENGIEPRWQPKPKTGPLTAK